MMPNMKDEAVTNIKNHRRVVLSPEQKREAEELQRIFGFTRMQARRLVLTPEQREEHDRQTRDAERRRYEKNPYRETLMRARQSAMYRRRRDGVLPENEFTISVEDLEWPPRCPVLGIELHYRGWYRRDPAGASLDRKDVRKGYIPGNVHVVSLRANLLRNNASAEELQALADFFLFDPYDPDLD
jgi:hypothetical protein